MFQSAYPGERPHCTHDRRSRPVDFRPNLARRSIHSTRRPSLSYWVEFSGHPQSLRPESDHCSQRKLNPATIEPQSPHSTNDTKRILVSCSYLINGRLAPSGSWQQLLLSNDKGLDINRMTMVISNSYRKAKSRAPAFSRALQRIRAVVQSLVECNMPKNPF